MSKLHTIGTVFFLAVLLVLSVPGAAADGLTAQTSDTDLEADDIVLSIDLHEDGTASWRIEHRYRLGDDETEAAFQSLQSDIETNQSDHVGLFTERMEPTVQSAQEATGREMELANVRVTAEERSLPQEYGIVTYGFDWTGFTSVDDTSISAGDALAGFFLDDETRLVMSWPAGYELQRVAPQPDEERDQSVMWRGPKDFGAGEPAVVVSTEEAAADGAAAWWGVVSSPVAVIGGSIIAAVSIAGAVFWRRRMKRGGARPPEASSSTPTGDRELDDSSDDGDETRWELLSNGEKVVRLLEDNGGRIKQQEVVQTFGWSDANTSQVVRDLREDGTVETFRIGRENVIVLADDGETSPI